MLSPGTPEFESLIRWLVARQTAELEDDQGDNEETISASQLRQLQVNIQGLTLDDKISGLTDLRPNKMESEPRWAGFNGRCNKLADTCYSFWNMATLQVSLQVGCFCSVFLWCLANIMRKMVERLSLIDAVRNRRFLLEQTQHIVGGFGKGVGEQPGM